MNQVNFDSTIKVLNVQSPSKLIEPNKTYQAKIVSNDITYKKVTTKKDNTALQIAEVLVAIEGFKPFKAALITEEVQSFLSKQVNDIVSVFIKFDGKYTNAEI